jgi:hypothetical protein
VRKKLTMFQGRTMIKRTFLAAIFLTLFACGNHGGYEPDEQPSSSSVEITFEDIQYWVGKGENRAMLIIQWNDNKSPGALAYGYRWDKDETKKGYNMINDIAKEDERLFYLRFWSGDYLGYAIAGIGFDISGNAKIGNGTSCEPPVDGSVNAERYDFDNWKLCDGFDARWGAGWYDGYWSYWVADNPEDRWVYSGLGASSRELTNNSIDAWYFDLDMNDPDVSTYHRCMMTPGNCDGRTFFSDIAPAIPQNH